MKQRCLNCFFAASAVASFSPPFLHGVCSGGDLPSLAAADAGGPAAAAAKKKKTAPKGGGGSVVCVVKKGQSSVFIKVMPRRNNNSCRHADYKSNTKPTTRARRTTHGRRRQITSKSSRSDQSTSSSNASSQRRQRTFLSPVSEGPVSAIAVESELADRDLSTRFKAESTHPSGLPLSSSSSGLGLHVSNFAPGSELGRALSVPKQPSSSSSSAEATSVSLSSPAAVYSAVQTSSEEQTAQKAVSIRLSRPTIEERPPYGSCAVVSEENPWLNRTQRQQQSGGDSGAMSGLMHGLFLDDEDGSNNDNFSSDNAPNSTGVSSSSDKSSLSETAATTTTPSVVVSSGRRHQQVRSEGPKVDVRSGRVQSQPRSRSSESVASGVAVRSESRSPRAVRFSQNRSSRAASSSSSSSSNRQVVSCPVSSDPVVVSTSAMESGGPKSEGGVRSEGVVSAYPPVLSSSDCRESTRSDGTPAAAAPQSNGSPLSAVVSSMPPILSAEARPASEAQYSETAVSSAAAAAAPADADDDRNSSSQDNNVTGFGVESSAEGGPRSETHATRSDRQVDSLSSSSHRVEEVQSEKALAPSRATGGPLNVVSSPAVTPIMEDGCPSECCPSPPSTSCEAKDDGTEECMKYVVIGVGVVFVVTLVAAAVWSSYRKKQSSAAAAKSLMESKNKQLAALRAKTAAAEGADRSAADNDSSMSVPATPKPTPETFVGEEEDGEWEYEEYEEEVPVVDQVDQALEETAAVAYDESAFATGKITSPTTGRHRSGSTMDAGIQATKDAGTQAPMGLLSNLQSSSSPPSQHLSVVSRDLAESRSSERPPERGVTDIELSRYGSSKVLHILANRRGSVRTGEEPPSTAAAQRPHEADSTSLLRRDADDVLLELTRNASLTLNDRMGSVSSRVINEELRRQIRTRLDDIGSYEAMDADDDAAARRR